MQIIENSKVKEKVYIEKLKNGLTVMIVPKKDIQKNGFKSDYFGCDIKKLTKEEFKVQLKKRQRKINSGLRLYAKYFNHLWW